MSNLGEIRRKTLDIIGTYGDELFNLEGCERIYQQLLQKKENLETELISDHVVKEANNFIERSKDLIKETRSVIEETRKELDDANKVKKILRERLTLLISSECTVQYMKVIRYIDNLSDKLENEVRKGDDEKCVTLFANLTEISRNLIGFRGVHLKRYLKDTIYHWHEILKKIFAKKFDEILKSIKWPFISTNFSLVVPLPTQVQKLQMISEYLLQIEIPTEIAEIVTKPALLADFPPLSLPIEFLVQPLRKRFNYHFYGARQTNRVDKPEWYFTQILTWVRDHKDFIETYIQPVVDKMGLHHIDAKLEFVRGLVEIAVEKLDSELPNLQYDDFIFSHAIDEALSFNKELRDTYDYPRKEPNILTVLTQGQVFMKWLSMEKKFAMKKMDGMFPPNSSEAFETLPGGDMEDMKVTTCADAFVTLVNTITERYEALPQPGHKLQFLDLQLELLDDFRVRLLQLVNAEEGNIVESRVPAIVNSVFYVENVLVDWGAMLHYMYLHYYKDQLDTAEKSTNSLPIDDDGLLSDHDNNTVFTETLSLYTRMRKDLLCNIAETVMAEVKKQSREYRQERWFMMRAPKELNSCSLTPSACPMFETLSKRLYQLNKSLQKKLFTFVWRFVAQQLDSYLFENLVMDNRFNESGALQLKYDVTRNLIPLFAQFSEKPQNYFTELIEACTLLNIGKGTAMILALEEAEDMDDMRKNALKDIGVTNLTLTMAAKVLRQRMDISGKMSDQVDNLS